MAVIFHADLDSFYVSAERLRRPELRGKCVGIGGDGRRGVLSSCSYEARKFGVRSAMPTAQALRLCPQLILCPPDFSYYSSLSRKVFGILETFTPVMEQVSIDEAYLDMTGTGSLFGSPREAAEKLRRKVEAETGLTVSVGIASNRLVAKIASDFRKPNAVYEVETGQEAAFLAPLPVRALPGCGKVTEAWLESQAIFRVEQLQQLSVDALEKKLGQFGRYLHEAAWGRGSTAFHEEAKVRSSSREMTFEEDLDDPEALKAHLWSMVCELGSSLRSEDVYSRAIRLKLRYPPFETVTRSRVLEKPVRTDRALYDAAERLFLEHWRAGGLRPLRLLGVGCVIGDGAHQTELFDSPERELRGEALDRIKDELRRRFGEKALGTGRDLGAE